MVLPQTTSTEQPKNGVKHPKPRTFRKRGRVPRWTDEEKRLLVIMIGVHGRNWASLVENYRLVFPRRTRTQITLHAYQNYQHLLRNSTQSGSHSQSADTIADDTAGPSSDAVRQSSTPSDDH